VSRPILVVDDDSDFRDLLRIALETWGFQCLEACDGASAIQLLDSEHPSPFLVLLDYFMPGISPKCCVAALHTRLGSNASIVLMSACVDLAERAMELGLSRALSKPFDLDELFRMAKELSPDRAGAMPSVP
jgi:CheY-like chemotaxis protein